MRWQGEISVLHFTGGDAEPSKAEVCELIAVQHAFLAPVHVSTKPVQHELDATFGSFRRKYSLLLLKYLLLSL